MSKNENEENKSFKVNDRRRFDDSGNEKISMEVTPEKQPDNELEEEHGFVRADSEQDFQINFPSFIASLATQALILMGELPAPEGMGASIDLDGAKQTIDIIAMLQEKTVGNLEPEEANFMQEMLHNLRLAYLKHQS